VKIVWEYLAHQIEPESKNFTDQLKAQGAGSTGTRREERSPRREIELQSSKP
jgi:hypothetical protein